MINKINIIRLKHGIVVLILVTCYFSANIVSYANVRGSAYTANVTASYKHPTSGDIEDAGSNNDLGESMVESVVHQTALVEKLNSGETYATVRILLTDNISDVQFFTQTPGESNFNATSSSIIQENIGGVYCTDHRFIIPSEEVIVKVSLFVTPMGRNVIFFFNLSNLKEGNADFILSVDTESVEQSEQPIETRDQEIVDNTESTNGQEPAYQANEDNETNENNTIKVNTTEKLSAGQLLERAQGLTLSDETILNNYDILGEGETATSTTEENRIKPLPWVLVWQCILIMTVPSLIIGMMLILVKYLFVIKRGIHD